MVSIFADYFFMQSLQYRSVPVLQYAACLNSRLKCIGLCVQTLEC